jgi:serine/threonine protein kinase
MSARSFPTPPQGGGADEPPSGVSQTMPAPSGEMPPSKMQPLAPPMSQPRIPTLSGTDEAGPKRCSVCDNRYPADFLICPRDGTPLEVDASAREDPHLGRVLGDTYQILRLVGEGGMGRVYEAKHLRLRDRRFAVKILHPEFSQKAEIVSRFQQEAESASAIDHPNVVSVLDVHRTADGQPYLVGEFLDGEELGKRLLRLGKLEVPAAVHLVRQVCRALAAAHARGIVHRDMKPENVFLSNIGGGTLVKVLDFGISKAAGKETNLTRTGMIMGTPQYMAPEQARGDKVDLRTDVYATGALLYHMVTGRPPFDGEDPTGILSSVLTEEPARPRSIEPGLPEGLELVIQRAMAKDPRERYQSMAELDLALAPFDTGTETLGPLPVVAGHTIVTEGNKKRGRDATANTVMADTTGSTSLADVNRVKYARPVIVALSIGLGIWLVGGFVGAVAGLVRYFRNGELTDAETALVLAGSILAAATPGFLFVNHVRKVVWKNSVRAVELAADIRRTAGAAFMTYGFGAIATRIAVTVFLHTSPLVSSGLWDVTLFGFSLLAGLVAGGWGIAARAAKKRANG